MDRTVMLLLVGVILLLLLLPNLLWWRRADALLRRHGARPAVRLLPALLALGMFGLLMLMIGTRAADAPMRELMPTPVRAAVLLWHIVILPLWLGFSAFVGLFSVVGRLWVRDTGGRAGREGESRDPEPRGTESHEVAPQQTAWSRRRFVATLAAAAPPAAIVGLTVVSVPQLRRFRIRRFELPVPGLPPALHGLTIAHVSDTHVGPFTYGRTVEEIVGATNRLKADLVLLTGDLIDYSLDDLPEAAAMVRSLESRFGVFLCEGNHDLIPGRTEFVEGARAAGLHLLVNEARTVDIRGEAVQVMGLRWGAGGPHPARVAGGADETMAASLGELLEHRDPDAFPILLAHHPHAFDPAAAAGIPLVLAGHTHGGQLNIREDFGFGRAVFRYWSGLYRKPQSVLAVSNGVGNWFPLRTAAPAEILHLTLGAE